MTGRTAAFAVVLLIGKLALVPGASAKNSLIKSLVRVSADEIKALKKAKIKDTRRLYQKTYKSPKALKTLQGKTRISLTRLASLAGVADLCRLYKVTPRVAQLLLLAGIPSMVELAKQDAEDISKRITAINEAQKLTRNLPSTADLRGWIRDARVLQPEDWEQSRKAASVR